jgi:Transposase
MGKETFDDGEATEAAWTGADRSEASRRGRDAGKDVAAVLQALEVSEATYLRWRNQYGGMKAEEAKRLKEIVAELTLDNRMLKHVAEKNW